MLFSDRADAGRRLADRLAHLGDSHPVVLGLPRGGVPVAREVAAALGAPLDVIVVRKLGVPFQPELGMGAIGEEGVRVVNRHVMRMAGVDNAALERVERSERAELERRARRFRGDRPPVALGGRTVVIVDDGIATGSTARAACQIARARGAARVVLAVPVAPGDWAERLAGEADEFVAVATPREFYAIGQFYRDFTQTSDAEVVEALDAGAEPHDVRIELDDVGLEGELTVPPHPKGVVVFAHGSGSSRHSPRNRFVAGELVESNLATLLFDLLTDEEAADRANVFDIDLLGSRLVATIGWLRDRPGLQGLGIGLFGASTGAAAALWASCRVDVSAVVSRGGRPDLAGDGLAEVTAPTLLIVGGADPVVADLNRRALESLGGECRLEIVPGAGHLFEEPGALEAVAELAAGWFGTFLPET